MTAHAICSTGAMMAPPTLAIERAAAMSERPVPPGAARDSKPVDAESSFALVVRAQEGDERAVDELCRRYLPRLNRWAHGRLPVWARGALDTQDLVGLSTDALLAKPFRQSTVAGLLDSYRSSVSQEE